MTSACPPVLVVAFNRPAKVRRLIDTLRPVAPGNIYVAIDGPRPSVPSDKDQTDRVVAELSAIDWPCAVKVQAQSENLGCRYGPAAAFSWFFGEVEAGIILEDDCLPSVSFFEYCRVLLDRYADDKRIWDIAGSNLIADKYPQADTSYVYSRYGEIHGWATWRDRWQGYDVDFANVKPTGEWSKVISRLEPWELPDVRERHFESICNGKDTWDYQWFFQRVANDGLSIVPSVNLVQNIGYDAEGTHTTNWSAGADLKARDMSFPLVAPEYVARDVDRDKRFVREAYKHLLEPWPKRLARRIMAKLK